MSVPLNIDEMCKIVRTAVTLSEIDRNAFCRAIFGYENNYESPADWGKSVILHYHLAE